jgi:hypothetical protein
MNGDTLSPVVGLKPWTLPFILATRQGQATQMSCVARTLYEEQIHTGNQMRIAGSTYFNMVKMLAEAKKHSHDDQAANPSTGAQPPTPSGSSGDPSSTVRPLHPSTQSGAVTILGGAKKQKNTGVMPEDLLNATLMGQLAIHDAAQEKAQHEQGKSAGADNAANAENAQSPKRLAKAYAEVGTYNG